MPVLAPPPTPTPSNGPDDKLPLPALASFTLGAVGTMVDIAAGKDPIEAIQHSLANGIKRIGIETMKDELIALRDAAKGGGTIP